MQQIPTAQAAPHTPPQGGQRDSVTVRLDLYVRARITFKINHWDRYSDLCTPVRAPVMHTRSSASVL